MVDFQVELYDGQYHDVDSSEMAFKIAGSLAYKDAMAQVPADAPGAGHEGRDQRARGVRGRVMGDLSSRRGRAAGHGRSAAACRSSRPQVPMSEMLDLRRGAASMTGARGSFHMEMSHYDEVPGHLQDKIIATSKAERGGEVQGEA